MDIKKEYPGVWNYYYAPLVNKKDLANHVLGMQKRGFPEYRVSSSGESEKYLPITQAYGPENVDVKLNGTDLYANSEFRASLEESVDENRVSII